MTRSSLGRRPRSNRSHGQTLVEFALVLPIILVLLIGMIDLSRAVFVYNTLSQAARQAARVAIVNQNVDDVKDAAIAYAPTLGLTASSVDVCFKTSTSTLTNCSNPAADNCPQSTRAIGCLAIVQANVNYGPMTPFISTIAPTIPLSSVSVGSIEYVCPEGSATECT